MKWVVSPTDRCFMFFTGLRAVAEALLSVTPTIATRAMYPAKACPREASTAGDELSHCSWHQSGTTSPMCTALNGLTKSCCCEEGPDAPGGQGQVCLAYPGIPHSQDRRTGKAWPLGQRGHSTDLYWSNPQYSTECFLTMLLHSTNIWKNILF